MGSIVEIKLLLDVFEMPLIQLGKFFYKHVFFGPVLPRVGSGNVNPTWAAKSLVRVENESR